MLIGVGSVVQRQMVLHVRLQQEVRSLVFRTKTLATNRTRFAFICILFKNLGAARLGQCRVGRIWQLRSVMHINDEGSGSLRCCVQLILVRDLGDA